MPGLYARWIDKWERKLAGRDTDRVVRPFEWGLDWLGIPQSPNGGGPGAVFDYVGRNLLDSENFYAYDTPRDFQLDSNRLTFPSPVVSPFAENNLVHAAFFPVKDARRRAVLVLPQWNADAGGHIALCGLLNRFGLTALRMSMAYHDRRMPAGHQRAEYHVSPNIGRTIHASRQSVLDARACLDWLQIQGYERLAILGTSLGSCIAFIAAAHDRRVRAGVFNHVSMYFSDVVWTGLSTRHVREGFGSAITRDELQRCWEIISPAAYFDRLDGRELTSLLVWARYDSTFLPVYSRQVIESFRARGFRHRVLGLPCAHYTTGKFPFMLLDGFAMCRFLSRNL